MLFEEVTSRLSQANAFEHTTYRRLLCMDMCVWTFGRLKCLKIMHMVLINFFLGGVNGCFLIGMYVMHIIYTFPFYFFLWFCYCFVVTSVHYLKGRETL